MLFFPAQSGWKPPLKDWWMSELVGQKMRSSSGIGSEPHHTSHRHIGAARRLDCDQKRRDVGVRAGPDRLDRLTGITGNRGSESATSGCDRFISV
eukprot:scaffold5317_cov95-Isochrysis_galbana.AAC.1